MTKYSVGDVVEFKGLQGKIVSIHKAGKYPIRVMLYYGEEKFMLDGRRVPNDKKPVLELVKKGNV